MAMTKKENMEAIRMMTKAGMYRVQSCGQLLRRACGAERLGEKAAVWGIFGVLTTQLQLRKACREGGIEG